MLHDQQNNIWKTDSIASLTKALPLLLSLGGGIKSICPDGILWSHTDNAGTAEQRETEVTAYFTSQQLLLFAIVVVLVKDKQQ